MVLKSIKMCQYSMKINSSQLEGAKGAKVVISITSEAQKSMDLNSLLMEDTTGPLISIDLTYFYILMEAHI